MIIRKRVFSLSLPYHRMSVCVFIYVVQNRLSAIVVIIVLLKTTKEGLYAFIFRFGLAVLGRDWHGRFSVCYCCHCTVCWSIRVCVCIYTRNKREEKRESRLYSFASLIGYPRIKTQTGRRGNFYYYFCSELYLNIRPYRMCSPHPHARITNRWTGFLVLTRNRITWTNVRLRLFYA